LTQHPKRLIEVSLPLAEISKESAREKSIRHGHISTLHIWWARRPLAAMRAAIFAALMPAPATDQERKKLEALIKVIVDWDQVKNGNSEAIEEARRLIREAYPDGPPKLLDPFMGGGATGLEALRLGCETHAVELNPVAHLIELCTLVYPQKYGRGATGHRSGGKKPEQLELPGQERPRQLAMDLATDDQSPAPTLADDVRRWGEWVLARAKEEIGHLYENPAGDETIVGYLWARTVTCPNPTCRAEMPLVRQWWLAKTGKRKITLKPVVDAAAKRVTFEIVDLKGKDRLSDFDPNDGSTRQGAATCLVCNQAVDGAFLQQAGMNGELSQRLMAVIYEQDNAGKGYRPATEADEALFQEACNRLRQLQTEQPDLVPNEPIDPRRPSSAARGLSAVTRYGMAKFGDLFNSRQLLALVVFGKQTRSAYKAILDEGVIEERAKAIATYLALAIDRNADYNSSLCPWANNGEYAGHTFTRQALSMIWDYAELNPFSGATGDWLGALEWITRTIEHAIRVSNYSGMAYQGTATRLPYPDGTFEAVITDPPYYDAIPYSDLSDFFYVWSKQSIGYLYPDLFRTPLTPKSPEIIQHTARHGGDENEARLFYEQQMTQAFSEACRVLRPKGIFVVVFAHKSVAAWETLLNSLLDAGLVVTASWPLHTEMSNQARARETASLASSIFIVCRVRTTDVEGYFDDVRQELSATIKERLDFFWQQGIRGADFFISAIGPAVSVFGRYRKVYRLDGSEVGVRELLDLVQSSVAEYALDRILNGSAARVGAVDAATRYYLLHRWAYGSETVPFDDAMRLALALGADVSALMERRGLLQQSGETVSLLGPKQRGKNEELGLPDKSGRLAGVIDVLHRAAVLWESGDREALARFLADAAQGREEQLRLVAQTIINILPDDDSERRLLEGFLQGRDSLPEVTRQGRLL
jgi:adenine-specific DNA methylase